MGHVSSDQVFSKAAAVQLGKASTAGLNMLLMKWLAYSLADQPIETTITIMMTTPSRQQRARSSQLARFLERDKCTTRKSYRR